MNRNPIATIKLANDKRIVIELFHELAPNTVNSFIFLANAGQFNEHRISRVEPDYVVDVSTNAFGRDMCKYLITNESKIFDRNHRIKPELGTVAMGGYDGNIAGGEFFFPLKHLEKLDGAYPCFGKVLEGLDEIIRIGNLSVQEAAMQHYPGHVLHEPISDEIISSVCVETYGCKYPEPIKLKGVPLPDNWQN